MDFCELTQQEQLDVVIDLKQKCDEYGNTIAQQAERIKELEATLDRLYRVGHCGSVDSFLACDDEVKRGYFAMMVEESTDNKKLCKELAALRQRIDDAPIVAEVGSVQGQTAYVFQTSDRALLVGTKLISKEDLL